MFIKHTNDGEDLSKNKGCGTSSVTNHGEFRTSAFDFHTARTTMVAQVLFLRDLTKIHPHHIPQKNSRLGKSWFVRVTDQRNCC